MQQRSLVDFSPVSWIKKYANKLIFNQWYFDKDRKLYNNSETKAIDIKNTPKLGFICPTLGYSSKCCSAFNQPFLPLAIGHVLIWQMVST